MTFTATDLCNNANSTTARCEIIDTTPPTIDSAAVNETVECNGTGITSQIAAWLADNGHADASDVCSQFSWSNNFNANNFVSTCGGAGYIDVTFTATDLCNNANSTTARFGIVDNTPPAVTSASNGSAACQGTNPNANTAYIAWLNNHAGATAQDLCGGSITWGDNRGTASWVGTCPTTITITFTATDACNNTASTSATFSIFDVTAPTLSGVPANVTVDCDNVPAPATTVTAFDLCDSSPTLTMTQTSTQGSNPALCSYYTYVITRTWTATDACLNSTSQSQVITVQDITAPQWDANIVIPGNVVIDCDDDPDDFFWDPQYGTDYDDNCDPNPTLIVTNTGPTAGPNGNMLFTRTWQLVDACLNYSVTQTQTITLCACQYATYTQGFYGNATGTDCQYNLSTLNLLNTHLLLTSLTVGQTGHSFTFNAGDGACVVQYLPAGGSSGVLSGYDYYTDLNNNCQINATQTSNPPYPPFILSTSGKFYNILLGQTVTLALNLRYDGNLAGLPLPDQYNPWLWTTASNYVNNVCLDNNDTPTGTPQGFYIPVNVLIAMNSNGTNKTVTDLLNFANLALAGGTIFPATLPEVTMALNAINVGFDAARFFNGYHPAMPPKAVTNDNIPENFLLHQNHPNPFNPSTTITYTLPVDCTVRLAIYNSLGNEIAVLVNHAVPAGTHSVVWNSQIAGADLGSGVYTYRILAVGSDGEEFHDVKKMMLVK